MKKWFCLFILCCQTPCFAKANYQVELEGIKGDLKKTLLQTLSLSQPDLDLSDAEQLNWYADLGVEELQNGLKTFGYYHAKVLLQRESSGKKSLYTYHLQLGPLVYINSVQCELSGAGRQDDQLMLALEPLPLKPGEPFTNSHYEKAKTQVLQIIKNHGYAKAQYSLNRVMINPETNEAHIEWQIATGEKHYFGQTRFEDNPLSESLLKRYLPYYFGWPYANTQLQKVQAALLQSQYYQNVIAEPQLQDDSLEVPIVVHLTPNPPNHYEAGIGYGTDTGPRGTASWLRRYVNQYGHQLSVSANVSKVGDEVETGYKIPGKHPANDWYQMRLLQTREDYDLGYARTVKASAEQIKVLGAWQREAKVATLYENYREKEGDAFSQTALVIPSVVYQTTQSNDRFNPLEGHRFKWTLRGAWTTDNHLFSQTLLHYKQLWQPYQRGLITGKVDLGLTFPDHSAELPLSLRFYAGGSNSVRGYVYRSLGPKETDAYGKVSVVGGSHMATTSLGFEHFITEKFAVGPFWDMGNSMNNWHTGFKSGVGLGLRYNTLIGPLRLDVAKPINTAHGEVRMHLNIGPEF